VQIEPDSKSSRIIRFGGFEANLLAGELRKQGARVALQEQPFRVLAVLLENPGEVVSREQLRQSVWSHDTFVDFEHGLNTAVNKIRECLRDTATHPRFIETIPRRGYRFLAAVEPVSEADGEATKPANVPVVPASPRFTSVRRAAPWHWRRIHPLWATAAFLILAASIVYKYRFGFGQERIPATQVSSIAVLPFTDLSPARDQEYFSDGLTDELINALAKVPGLRVIGRTSAFEFKGKTQDVRTIGDRLNVATVLEGSVRKSGDRLRITAQLISTRTGYQLWSESYDSQLTDAFKVQMRIAETICDRLRLRSGSGEMHRARAHSSNAAAVDAYLKARHLAYQRTPDAIAKSIALFQDAITQDSEYALAYAGLANSYSLQTGYSLLLPSQAAPLIRAAALRAIALDDTLAEAHTLLGGLMFSSEWDWPGGERAQRRAIELEPRLAMPRQRYALNLMWMGRFDEALSEIRRAQELDPLSPVYHMNEGEILYNARQYDRAIEHCQKVRERAPKLFQTYHVLGDSYIAKRMYAQAIVELEQALSMGGDNPGVKGSLGHAYAASGDRRRALELLRELEQSGQDSAFPRVRIHLALGETVRALEVLEGAYNSRSRTMLFLRVAPILDPLRSEQKFIALMRRVPMAG
jgi:TolB-like protein/DNA-binding winged helix-turn-helix (wHTH) protein/Flp pilus assembly protein TadD